MTLCPSLPLRRPSTIAALLLAASPALLGAAPPSSAPAAVPAAAPVASATDPAAIPPFEVAENKKIGVWFGRFGTTNCSWIDMGDGVAVIDTGASEADAKNLLAQIAERTPGKTVRWVVLTHLHGDSNSGFSLFTGPDVTVFVHARSAEGTAAAIASISKSSRRAAVVGVSDRTVLATPKRRLELFASAGPAHTGADLAAYLADAGTMWVGDVVTPTRCPMTSDPQCDPSGWLAFLSTLEAQHPATIIATRGDATLDPAKELDATKAYLTRLIEALSVFKAKNFPEARVSAELSLGKIGEYCPAQLDAINAIAIYRRIGADGKIVPAAGAAKDPKTPKK